MLTVIVGPPGSGKGYWTCKEAMRLLRNGHTVLGNVPLKFEAIKAANLDRYGVEIRDEQWVPLKSSELVTLGKAGGIAIPEGTIDCPTVIFWDEAHFELNARDHASSFRMWRDLFDLITVHRHYHCDIYFVSQHEHNIDAQIPRCASRILKFQDMQVVPIRGLGIKWPFAQFRMNFHLPNQSNSIDGEFIAKETWIYGCYDSHNKLKAWESLQYEKCQVKRGVAPRRKRMVKLIAAVAVLAVGLFVTWRYVGPLVSDVGGKMSKVGVGDAPSSATARAQPPAPPEELRPPVPQAVSYGERPAVRIDGFKIWLGESWHKWTFTGLWEYGVTFTHKDTGREFRVRV